MSFTSPQLYQTGSDPFATDIGDVTGDGRNDVVMTTSTYFDPDNDRKLFVYRQRPDGTLVRHQRLATHDRDSTNSPFFGVDIGDLNGDGKNDVVVGSQFGLEIYLQADGKLQRSRAVDMGAKTFWVRIADIDGDGRNDIAVIRGVRVQDTLLYWARNTANGFLPRLVEPVVSAAVALDTGDLDGDGRTEIVTNSQSPASPLSVMEYQPGGAFSRWSTPIGYASVGVAIGRLTADALPDIAIMRDTDRR